MKCSVYSLFMTFLCASRQPAQALVVTPTLIQKRWISSFPSTPSLCSRRYALVVGNTCREYTSSTFKLHAMPKRGAVVDSYRTVDVNCNKCRTMLFEYKKKNGTKSSLVKMFIERIVKDPYNILTSSSSACDDDDKNSGNVGDFQDYSCPKF